MKRRIGWVALLLCVALLYGGCASNQAPQTAPGTPNSVELTSGGDYGFDRGKNASDIAGEGAAIEPDRPAAQAQDDVQKLIVTARMGMTADAPQAAADALMQKARDLGGYVSSSSMAQDDLGVSQAYVTLRVAPDALEQLTQAAAALGRVTSYDMDTQEITQEYWDVQARLKNAKAQEEQLLLLMEKAANVEETLQVRQALSDVQGEIESYQGQIKLWDNQVGYSTLTVRIDRSTAAAVSGSGDSVTVWSLSDVWTRMQNGFITTGRVLVNAGYSILILLAYLAIPLLAVAVVAVAVIVIVKVRRRKKALK